MNNLTTRKIVLGLLMVLVLTFSVQGIADALGLTKPTDSNDNSRIRVDSTGNTFKFTIANSESGDTYNVTITAGAVTSSSTNVTANNGDQIVSYTAPATAGSLRLTVTPSSGNVLTFSATVVGDLTLTKPTNSGDYAVRLQGLTGNTFIFNVANVVPGDQLTLGSLSNITKVSQGSLETGGVLTRFTDGGVTVTYTAPNSAQELTLEVEAYVHRGAERQHREKP